LEEGKRVTVPSFCSLKSEGKENGYGRGVWRGGRGGAFFRFEKNRPWSKFPIGIEEEASLRG
jgi:hypothetical protein